MAPARTRILALVVVLAIALGSTMLIVGEFGFGPATNGGGGTEHDVLNDPRLNRTASISLPIDLDLLALDSPQLGPIGTWGYHGGGHPEGFDHTAFKFHERAPIRAPDDGVVESVEYVQADDVRLVLFHNYSMASWFDHLGEVLVEKDDFVSKGQVIGYARPYLDYYMVDWGLVDFKNKTGPMFPWFFTDPETEGSLVPPFNYLDEQERTQVEDAFNQSMLQPFLQGSDVPRMSRAEYRLVNPIFPLREGESDIAGVWVYGGLWGAGGPPEIMTFVHADTEYFGRVQHAVYYRRSADGHSETWEAEYEINTTVTPHRIRLHFTRVDPDFPETIYGIYEVYTSNSRLHLRIEFSNDTHPTTFSESAADYFIRSRLHPENEANIPSSCLLIWGVSGWQHWGCQPSQVAGVVVAVDVSRTRPARVTT
ncbi:MAG: M23 family metallopeptidase [Candidatus Thorarchaeota archaeon]